MSTHTIFPVSQRPTRFDAAYDLHRALARIAHSRNLQYTVQPQSPENLPELLAASTSRLVVLGEYSDQTIYGLPSDNHLQRAWHDTLHLELLADTSAHGEYRVARAQCNELECVAGTTLANLLWADLYGQTLHYGMYGCFPTDQASFVWDFLTTNHVNRF
jgi:hypothetical protein